MLCPLMKVQVFLVAMLGLSSCSKEAPTPTGDIRASLPPARDPAGAAAVAETSSPSSGTATGGCAAAALPLDPQSVVARVGSKTITVADLDPKAKNAEEQALRRYCTEVGQVRQAAVDRVIEDTLLENAARAEGIEVQEYLQRFLQAEVAEPSDAEVAAFYDRHKKDDAPPLDAVRDQVAAAMRRDASEEAVGKLLRDLKAASTVETMLPDLRPAAIAIDVPAHSPGFGSTDAAVEVVEFSDFECPYCAHAAAAVNTVKAKYGDEVRFAFRHFPLSFHPNAKPAAEYAQCAHEQGKFWSMHDAIFANQRNLSREGLERTARDAGVDLAQLEACLASGRAAKAVEDDLDRGIEVGVQGTPSFFVNGHPVEGGASPEALSAAIDAELARAKG
jgi:protein-disulfide isomerase